MVKKIFSILFYLLVISSAAFCQQVTVKASTDAKEYTVGDFITFKIEVTHPEGVKIQKPALKDSLKNAEIISYSLTEGKKENEKITDVFSFTIAKYDSGDVKIPALNVQYSANGKQDFVQTNELTFTVKPVKIDPQKEFKDIKDPVYISMPWWVYALWTLGIIAACMAGYYGYVVYKKRKAGIPVIAPVIKTPHEKALDALSELKEKKLWQSGKVKEYHSELTFIIRQYFEKIYSVPALEATSAELMTNLRKAGCPLEVTDITRQFLDNADMVKFAKYIPMDHVNEEMMTQAQTLVRKTAGAANA
jgi:hypothetical protein